MEAKSMEEALKAYQSGKFSRRSLFEFVVARIKASEERTDRLEGQMKDLVGALVRGMQDKDAYEATIPAQIAAVDELSGAPRIVYGEGIVGTPTLQAQAESLGIKVDRRWSPETLKQKIASVNGALEPANG